MVQISPLSFELDEETAMASITDMWSSSGRVIFTLSFILTSCYLSQSVVKN